MILKIIGHNYRYEMECLCRIFFPAEKIIVWHTDDNEQQPYIVTTKVTKGINAVEIYVKAEVGDKSEFCIRSIEDTIKQSDAEIEKTMAMTLFYILSRITGYVPPWGILTGVRPAKLMSGLISTLGEIKAVEYFKNEMLASYTKAELAFSVAKCEKEMMNRVDKNLFSLYIAIPFCPSRCSYCSFVSHSIASAKAKKTVPVYVAKLCEEIKAIGHIASEFNISPQTIYFGGGTPTSLDEQDLERLFLEIENSFNLSEVIEYTVEAGRPDTISSQRLSVLKQHGISRISINPQSFNDRVLEVAQRNHTSKCAIDAFKLARKIGFDNINMDLIAGLPTDIPDSFERTLSITLDLVPENVTVHTLALKRASDLNAKERQPSNSEHVSKMLKIAENKLKQFSYMPYYMYRQSLSVGNHENVGWSKPGYEGFYNVIMMEECQTVLAAGAGGVTKLVHTDSNRLERIFNFKYPYEYIRRFDEITDRKQSIVDFYANNRQSSFV